MSRILLSFRSAALFALLLSLGGCGGCGEEDDRQAAPESSDPREIAGVDACAGLSASRAAELLDVEPDQLTRRASFSNGITCAIGVAGAPGRGLGFSVNVLSSDPAARELFDSKLRALRAISPVEALADLGDAASQANGPAARRLLFRKDRVLVDVVEPADSERQRQLARAIAEGL